MIREQTEAGRRAPGATRAALILKFLASQREGLGVTEIARRLDLVPSSCLRVLRALVEEGFVAFDADRTTYRTSIGLLSLVRNALVSSGFQDAVQPQLDRLASRHALTAVAVELDPWHFDRLVVVAMARGSSVVSLHINVGSRFPSLIGATGRCVAAESELSKAELQERFKGLRWERAPSFERWYEEVKQARTAKVAMDDGSYIRGVTVFSTLLPRIRAEVTRGIALFGLQHQMTAPMLEQLRSEILEAAREVSVRS